MAVVEEGRGAAPSAPPEEGGAAAGSALVVEQLPQLLAGLEVGDALRGDADLLAGLRVAAGPRPAAADPEAAEAPQLDLLPLLERVDDAVEDRVDDDLRVLLGELRGAGDLLH